MYPQNLGEAYFTCIAYGSCGLLIVCMYFILSSHRAVVSIAVPVGMSSMIKDHSSVETTSVSVAEKLGYNLKLEQILVIIDL